MRIHFDLANPVVIKTNSLTVIFVQKFSVKCDDDQILHNVSSQTCALWCTKRSPFENTHGTHFLPLWLGLPKQLLQGWIKWKKWPDFFHQAKMSTYKAEEWIHCLVRNSRLVAHSCLVRHNKTIAMLSIETPQ